MALYEPDRVSPSPSGAPTIVIQQPRTSSWLTWLLLLALGTSMFFNLGLFAVTLLSWGSGDASERTPPLERFHSGDSSASEKIAVVEISGTIMPPFTERLIDTLKYLEEDRDVKGVVLLIDSPGGLVADSHQIYHQLGLLRAKRPKLPVYVAMSRMAASGGYYVAMGAGPDAKIYAEPTTWTGSIGVIIPRYNVSKLATDFGVRAEPLTTGPFKDALSPFREMSDEERTVWQGILDDAFHRFQEVIVSGRKNLSADDVRALATGRIYTADQAMENGLIDEIGYLDDAVAALQSELKLSSAHVVKYEYPLSLSEVLFGSAEAAKPVDPLGELLESGVPRAMYFCGWHDGVSN